MKSIIVLCGGMSRRMGQDKGSMNLNGKPMIIRVIETIAHAADEIVLVLKDENQVETYKKFLNSIKLPGEKNLMFCTDILKEQGPLAGILTGLQHINADKALVIPCDSPFISEVFVNTMFELSEDSNFDAYVPKWSDGKLEPLHSIYKKNVLFLIQKLLEEDIRSVKVLISQLNVKFIDVEYLDISGRSFLNINQMNDLKDIIDKL